MKRDQSSSDSAIFNKEARNKKGVIGETCKIAFVLKEYVGGNLKLKLHFLRRDFKIIWCDAKIVIFMITCKIRKSNQTKKGTQSKREMRLSVNATKRKKKKKIKRQA